MTQATIIIPDAVEEKVKTAVLKRAADEFGGFTTTQSSGGWRSPDGDLIREPVTQIKVIGAGETWAKSTANWVAKKTDETEVLWQVVDTKVGFESA